MAFDLNIGDALKGAFGLIDDLYTSDEEREAAKLKLVKLQQEGKLKMFQAQMSVMLAEAQSKDKWTSRARPTFFYVMYIMILVAIPMGVIGAFNPELAEKISTGVLAWLGKMPDKLWDLFLYGFLGYTGARSFEKHSRAKHNKVDK